MKKILYILLLVSFLGHSQHVIRMTENGRILNGRMVVGSGGGEEPTNPIATITATDGTATESGTTTGEFTVTLSSASSGTTTVNFTVGGTAVSGTDYVSIGTSVDITDGNTSATITVTPIDDGTVETTETVIVTLASGTGYDVGSPSSATVNITSDDSSGGDPLITIAATDSIATEAGTTTATFTITASEAVSGDVTVNYRDNGLAESGSDYTALTGTATISDGNTSTTITLTPTNDSAIEPVETVMITLEDGSGYELGNDIHAVATITSDDTDNLPSVSGVESATTLADLTGSTHAGKYVTIDANINATGATFNSNIVIRAGTGVISGTSIDLNGAGIEDSSSQIFDDGVTFDSPYTLSRLRPEVFGAVSGDATDDTDAIDALINNVQHATATSSGSYMKNNDSYYTRSGLFDWDMNGATVQVTSSTNFPTGTVSTGGVFEFTNTDVRVYNGEFDGNDTYGRLFYLHGQDHYMFNDLNVHDLYATTTYRCVAFRFTIDSGSSGFRWGELRDNIVDNIVAEGDGDYNNSPAGVSKFLWYTMSGADSSTEYDNLYVNNTVSNVIGDDAEGWYAIQYSGTREHKGSWVFMYNDFSNCTRRTTKACVSNVAMYDNTFTELEDVLYLAAAQMGSMVDFFNANPGGASNIENLRLIRNRIETATGEKQHYNLLSFTDAEGIIVRENTIEVHGGGNNLGTVRLGSNTGSYTGSLADFEFSNNTLIDANISIMNEYSTTVGSPLQIFENDFTYNYGNAYNVAPIWWYGSTSGNKGYIDFDDNDIVFDAAPSNISGLVRSTSANIDIPGFNADGNNITFNSTAATYEIGYILGDMTSSSITNTTVTGGSGSPELRIDGTEGVTTSGNTPTITIN